MRRILALVVVVLSSGCGADAPHPVSPPSTSATAHASAGVTVAPPLPQPKTVRRVAISHTRPSGASVTTTAPDGAVTTTFDMMENGRGPHVEAKIRLFPDGTIASLEAHGHHTMGLPIDETYAADGRRAVWKSREESGDRELKGPTFFIPMAPIPEATGMLAVALLKAGGTMPLFPGGDAQMEKVGDATVRAGDKQKHLVAYALTGLELTPTIVWMEDDGSYFGVAEPWFGLVPEGWESVIDPLFEKQKELERERDKRVAARFTHRPPPQGVAFTHARVLDVERGTWSVDQTVIVIGDTIKSWGPSETTLPPSGMETIDLAGKALLPGLWDMHAHLGPADGALDIASGVTTARDVGNDPDRLDDFKKRFDDGSAIGPHVLRAGLIEGRGEKAASSRVTAESEAEAKAAVDLYAKRGYEGIKVYNSVKPELVPLIAREAHARGMYVTGHIPVHMLANEAVRAGYDGIEHVNMLFLNFFADHDTDTRTTTRFSLVADKAASFDLKSKPAQDFFALLREHHTLVVPTLDAFEDLFVGQPGKVTTGLESIIERLPAQTQRTFLLGGLPMEQKEDLYRRSWDKVLAMVKELRDAKIQTVVGTDQIAGLMEHHELELFVRAGIAPIDAIRAATIEPARAMKQDRRSGSIKVGKIADMFVVDGDPLARIGDVRKVVTTMRAGVLFSSNDLYASVGVRPWGGPK